jgi:hypothetical protein
LCPPVRVEDVPISRGSVCGSTDQRGPSNAQSAFIRPATSTGRHKTYPYGASGKVIIR